MKKFKYLIPILILGLFIFLTLNLKSNFPNSVLAKKVINRCKNSAVHELCYNVEIPKLMKFLTMEDAFAVTSEIQNNDSDFPYCHVLGHELASIETKKDPSSWRQVIARCPSGVCSNGCVHGAFQEKYKGDVLTGSIFEEAKKEFSSLCEDSESLKLSGLMQGSCYHALGHLLMYVTGADIKKSTSTCDEIAIKKDGKDYSNVCYDGAFMQIFQPLDSDDKALVRNFNLNNQNVWDFCKQFSGTKRTSCWRESWPLFLNQISKAPGLVSFCSKLDSNARQSCLNNMFYIMPIQFKFNEQNINSYCLEFDNSLQPKCFAMTASRILEIDKKNTKRSIEYCARLTKNNREYCFSQIIKDAKFDFLPNSVELNNFCATLPESFRSECKQK